MSNPPPVDDRHRIGRVLLCLCTATFVLLAGATSAEAATKRSVALKVSSASVSAGAKVTLSGRITKSPKGTKIRIEQLVGRQWKSAKTAKTTTKQGKFTASLVVRATTSYRAVAPKTKQLKAATSKTRTVTVQAAATPVPQPPAPQPRTDPAIATKTLPNAMVGDSYSQALTTVDGRGGTWSIAAASIPEGLSLESGTGIISGVPAAEGANQFTVRFTDNGGGTATQQLLLVVDPVTESLTTVQVSKSASGDSGDGYSYDPSISDDGRYVAFISGATNLIAGRTTTGFHLFVWDRTTGSLQLVPDAPGSFEFSISGNGSYLAYEAGGKLFLWDRTTGDTELVWEGRNGGEYVSGVSISGDGQRVAYSHWRADETQIVYLWDRATDSTQLVSKTAAGAPLDSSNGPSVSRDGRFVAFASSQFSPDPYGNRFSSSNVLLWDGTTGLTQLVSKDTEGGPADDASFEPSVSGDGRYVAFTSRASDLVAIDTGDSDDVFVWDRISDSAELVSKNTDGTGSGNRDSLYPSISADGRFVGFNSYAYNLVPGTGISDREFYLWDRISGSTRLVSVNTEGSAGNGETYNGSVSGDGRYVAFSSRASDLVARHPKDESVDVFLWDRLAIP